MTDTHYLVPAQEEGIEKNIAHSITAATVQEAEDWFVDGKERLLDVNNWKRYSVSVSAEFRLTDHNGKPANRVARKGDHIKIDIPGPGSEAGSGFDWVVIEAIEYDDYPDEDMETIAMRVRPAENPTDRTETGIAHFFSDSATSTFVVERTGKKVAAKYYGRNESANIEGGVVDKVRNTGVAIGAWLGMSDAQWTSLVKGLIE